MLKQLMHAFLTNVPSGIGNVLSWAMLVVVAILLVSSATLAYIFYRKNKRENPVQAVSSA
jgi:RsiW-degrading membrane proteinase PrsW (M82 family)